MKRRKSTLKRVYPQLVGIVMTLLLAAFVLPSFASEGSEENDAFIPITPLAEYGYADVNLSGVYLSDVLGISRAQFIKHMTDNADKYLDTPYVSGAAYNYNWEDGPWWAQGYPAPNGYVGLNCAGFVASAFFNATGGVITPFMQTWYDSPHDAGRWSNAWQFGYLCYSDYYNLTYYDFSSFEAMILSGLLEKGDIIYMRGEYVDDHMGIFWGESPYDNTFWHSAFGVCYADGNVVTDALVGNAITQTGAKDPTPAFWRIVKFSGPSSLKIAKVSSNPSMTDGNSCYSLEGAVYGIYPSAMDAAFDTNRITTLITDETGLTSAATLSFGCYWIKEITAPLGYALDTVTYTFDMMLYTPDANGVYTLQLSDEPHGDPITMRIQKLDTLTGEAYGTDDPTGLSLAGAQFTWRYFDGYYTTPEAAETSGAPTRTWVLETKANGVARFMDVEPNLNYFVPGSDALYKDGYGNPIIPLGTIIIQETKAPDAYLLPSPNPVYVLLITMDSSGDIIRTLYKDGVEIQGYINNLNEYTLAIDEAPHSAKVTKISAHTGEAIANTEFTLYKESIKGAGDWTVIGVKKTDTEGVVIFSPLTVGSYKLEETAANPLYAFEEESVVKYFEITAAVLTVEYVVENTTCIVEVTKTDSETGEAIANTEFTLYKESAVGVGDWEVIGVKVTNSQGKMSFAPLSVGSYKIEETASNPAYIFEAGIYVEYFEVTEDTTSFDFAFENTLSKVEIVKTDSETGEAIINTEFTLYKESTKGADDWTVVSFKTTDTAGKLTFPLVAAGSYKIEETASNPAYIFEEGVHVKYFDVTYETGTLTFAFENTLSSVEVVKIDTDSKNPISDTEFTLYIESEKGLGDWAVVSVGSTDAAGKLTFALTATGSYKIEETAANPAYIFEEGVHVQYFDVAGQIGTLTFTFENKARSLEVIKVDKDTNKPVSDTEFTLYRESAVGVGDWQVVGVKVTDTNGKLVFSPVATGSYRLSETRPNVGYASLEESGDSERYFELTSSSAGQVQVFEDMVIQISVEVYKDTINITSAAFKTFDEDYLQVNNIGIEEYAYRVGFRSTSNVRADECTVIDYMENAQAGQVRLTQLWTPVAYGDTDGCFNLWYRTNYTDPTQVYSNANAMDSNPFNINNPSNVQLYSSVGWHLWAEGLSTTETTHLLVSDLNLKDDEYITGVRYEYGSVEVGFTTGNGPIPIQQIWKPDLDWTPMASPASTMPSTSMMSPSSLFSPSSSLSPSTAAQDISPLSSLTTQGLEQAAQAKDLYPAYYLVVCPVGIEPPEEIRSTVIVQIARNAVLTDDDADYVITTTITPFFEEFNYANTPDTSTPGFPFPQTGDTRWILILIGVAAVVIAIVVLIVAIRLRGPRH